MTGKINSYKQSFLLLIFIFSISICKINPQTNHNLMGEESKALIAEKYIHAINSGNKERIKEFIIENYDSTFLKIMPLEYHITFQMSNYYISGGLGYELAIDSNLNRIKLTNRLTGADLELIFQFSKEYSNRIINFPEFKPISNSRIFSNEEIIKILEKGLNLIIADDEFSGSVLIAQHGKPFFSKAFGDANKSFNIPNITETKFNIACWENVYRGCNSSVS